MKKKNIHVKIQGLLVNFEKTFLFHPPIKNSFYNFYVTIYEKLS